jgi:hypothetical protein
MKLVFAALLACVCLAQTPAPKKKEPPKKPPETFIQWLARVTGISATSSGLRGLRMEFAGDIWLAHIESEGGQRLTFDGSYSWPVFSRDDQAIIAIRGGELWSIPLDGVEPAKFLHSPHGVTALLGTGLSGIVVFIGDEVALFKPESGGLLPFKTTTQEDRDAIARMQEPIRSYGEITVSENGAAIDVVLNRQTHQLTAPDERLGEPSVSHDHKLIVYIRTK